jgi:hypothetical protein
MRKWTITLLAVAGCGVSDDDGPTAPECPLALPQGCAEELSEKTYSNGVRARSLCRADQSETAWYPSGQTAFVASASGAVSCWPGGAIGMQSQAGVAKCWGEAGGAVECAARIDRHFPRCVYGIIGSPDPCGVAAGSVPAGSLVAAAWEAIQEGSPRVEDAFKYDVGLSDAGTGTPGGF